MNLNSDVSIDLIQPSDSGFTGRGSLASMLINSRFDTNLMRPWVVLNKKTGEYDTYVMAKNRRTGKLEPTLSRNANGVLPRDAWLAIDQAAISVAKPRLKLVGDLRSAGLVYNMPGGMGKTMLETKNISDISTAIVSMDGLRYSQRDRPVHDITHLPLPIIHKDFSFTAREIAVSRDSGAPLDTTMAELSSRRVAEVAESLALGTYGTFSFGGGSVYGLTNYPGRMTKVMTNPTLTAWTPKKTIDELLAMRQQSTDAFRYGPWMVYVSPAWAPYLDTDYILTGGNTTTQTLRNRLLSIGDGSDIRGIRQLDYLTGYQMILVQMTSDVIREVIGMDFTTLQWETDGGMEVHFKIMCIMVPQIRSDQNGSTGIVHGVAT